MKRVAATFAALLLAAASCGTLPPGAEARSLEGRVLPRTPTAAAARARLEAELAAAEQRLREAPQDPDAAVWVGRRLAYLGRFRDAVDVYTAALQRHPDDPQLLRHRGHRHITLRALDRAIADLAAAARLCRVVADVVEPDGQPTPGRPPHSSLHYNVHYHLGLAHFLAGDFAAAERAWLDCLAVVANDESRVAVTHWLWCVRMRRRDPAGAAAVVLPIGPAMDVVENRGYHQLCLLYAGKLRREAIVAPDGSAGAALAFGLAHHALVTGERERARAELRALADAPGWAAFGVIAAEAECVRQGW